MNQQPSVLEYPARSGDGAGLTGVPDVIVRRLSNWITRVFHGTYGARISLRVILRTAARQMLEAGISESEVTEALERYVLNHPACLARDRTNLVTGLPVSQMLIDLTRQAVADVALEVLAKADLL